MMTLRQNIQKYKLSFVKCYVSPTKYVHMFFKQTYVYKITCFSIVDKAFLQTHYLLTRKTKKIKSCWPIEPLLSVRYENVLSSREQFCTKYYIHSQKAEL